MWKEDRCYLQSFFFSHKHILSHAALALVLILFPVQSYSEILTLTWDPNQESDLAGYRIYYGTTSGNLTAMVDVGNTTTYTLTDLEPGQTYYFSATAYDFSGNESDFCKEISHDIPANDGADDSIADSNADSDNDGMPDDWETQNGLDPNSDDALADPDGDGISNLDEYLGGTDPGIYNGNAEPDAPVLYAPVAHARVSLTPLLQTEAFYDPDFGDTHRQTQWQIFRQADDRILLDIKSPYALTSLSVPKLILGEDCVYRWRARFYDNHGSASPWSQTAFFSTDLQSEDADGNGIPDHQEVDTLLDMDGDGTADVDQEDIKCVNVQGTSTQVGISFKDSTTVVAIEALESMDPNDPQFEGKDIGKPEYMPFGLIDFKLIVDEPGAEAAVKVYLSEPAPEDSKWYKFDPIAGSWQDYTEFVAFSADRKCITLSLQDGGFGDLDGSANGIIVDPSGIAAASALSSADVSGDNGDILNADSSSASCFITAAARPAAEEQPLNLCANIRFHQWAILILMPICFMVCLRAILKHYFNTPARIQIPYHR